jgi:MoxR-like ATPase
VLRHRIVLSYEALAQGLTAEQILARLLSTVPAPRIAPTQPGGQQQQQAATASAGWVRPTA